MNEELPQVTLARIEVDANGCHVYLGAKTANGYGHVRRQAAARRAA